MEHGPALLIALKKSKGEGRDSYYHKEDKEDGGLKSLEERINQLESIVKELCEKMDMGQEEENEEETE